MPREKAHVDRGLPVSPAMVLGTKPSLTSSGQRGRCYFSETASELVRFTTIEARQSLLETMSRHQTMVHTAHGRFQSKIVKASHFVHASQRHCWRRRQQQETSSYMQ